MPMFPWRLLNLYRCSPRVGFSAILLFVIFTFALTTYLYSKGVVKLNVTELGKGSGHGGLLGYGHGEEGLAQARGQDSQLRNAGKPVSLHARKKNRQKGRKKKAREEEEEEELPLDGASSRQVSDVISLLAKFRSANETSTPAVQKKMLMSQIKLLREAMMSNKTMLPRLSQPPKCMDSVKEGEVEDILCIPRPGYLKNVKNPCWYTKDSLSPGVGQGSLRCLPYFHILGCAKAGTTDLWNRLMSHPHVVSNDGLLHKEALWWSWRRYGFSGYKRRDPMKFTDYVDLFQDAARLIQSSLESGNLYHEILITGDASPPDFWDFRGWVNVSQNRHSNTPHIVTPHLMKHFYANPKFILMFRDPLDRLYSDYFFVGGGLTSLDFHNDVLASIDMLARCVSQHGLLRCFHDHQLYVQLPVRLPFACYSLFMREWLQVFPLESFLFIKTEEYEENPEETLKTVMEFLGLGPLKDTALQEIAEEEKSRITIQKQIAGPMKNATKEILQELLNPCSKELARLIKMDKFIWDS